MNHAIATKYGKASLIAITLTAIATSVHHIFRLGWEALIPFVIIILLPYLLMRWFTRTANKVAYWGYVLVNTIIFLFFGVVDGFFDHVMKAIGLPNTTFLPGGQAQVVKTALSLWSPEAGNFLYEGTGILTFILSVVAIYFVVRWIQAQRLSRIHGTAAVGASTS
jgi:hypothetical protein